MKTVEDANEFLSKLRNGEDAQLQVMIEYWVKKRYSFEEIKQRLKEVQVEIDPNVLSSHYIMSSVETINKHQWDASVNPFIVIGNIGWGKSSLIQYLNKNVKAGRVQWFDQWSLNAKRKGVGPSISHSLSKAETVIPQEYVWNGMKSLPIIYDTPGFNIPDSYEQEIASWLSLQCLINRNRKCRLIPCFSVHELQTRGYMFHKFLDQLSNILSLPKVSDEKWYYDKEKYKWPSVYVVTQIDSTLKNRVIDRLKRISQEAPRHIILIEDIWEKLVVFPKPINGKFVGDLSNFIPRLVNVQPVPIKSGLPVSDGAKNKMRTLLDTWDSVLKDQFDEVFIRIIEPIIYENSLNYDIEFLQKFEKVSKIEDIPELLIELGSPSKSDTEADKRRKDIYVIVATTLKWIIPYRNILIELSGKKESGIFEAYLKNQIKYYVKEAKNILHIGFLIDLKSLSHKVNEKLRVKYFISKKNSGNLNYLIAQKIWDEKSWINFVKNKMGLSDLIEKIRSRKEMLAKFDHNQSIHYNDVIRDINKTLKERIEISKECLKNYKVIERQKDKIKYLNDELVKRDKTIKKQKEDLIEKENSISKLEEEIEQKNIELSHYKKKVAEFNSVNESK